MNLPKKEVKIGAKMMFSTEMMRNSHNEHNEMNLSSIKTFELSFEDIDWNVCVLETHSSGVTVTNDSQLETQDQVTTNSKYSILYYTNDDGEKDLSWYIKIRSFN